MDPMMEAAEKVEDAIDYDGYYSGDEDEELVDLPDEIEHLIRGELFDTERELLDRLEKLGFGDERAMLLDGKPRLISPSHEHNSFTSTQVWSFIDFSRKRGKWGVCSARHNIHLANGGYRNPDISYWGYPRCDNDGYPPLGAIPDVVIQFCWRNTFKYEQQAIDDMMNQGLENEGGPLSMDLPRLGYLIMMRFSRNGKLLTQDLQGVDIYRLPHGTTIKQALDPNDPSAQHWYYKPGDPEVLISIRRKDLGIPQSTRSRFMNTLFGNSSDAYTIKASHIYEHILTGHERRQKRKRARSPCNEDQILGPCTAAPVQRCPEVRIHQESSTR
jgi:hypothetical protein